MRARPFHMIFLLDCSSSRRPLRANSPEDLADCIRWASTAVLREASQPAVAPSAGPPPLAKPPPPGDLLVWGDDVTR